MSKSYGNHGEIFGAVLFDKFIFPDIKNQNIEFDFLGNKLYLDNRYEKHTKSGGTQLTDLWFELIFKDSNLCSYIANIFIESKTYISGDSDNALRESASKMADKLGGHMQSFFMNTIGSSYCIFRPCEVSLNQDAQLRLSSLCRRNIFPESRFEVCKQHLPIEKQYLMGFFDKFETVDGAITVDGKLKAWGTICQNAGVIQEIESIMQEEILNGNIKINVMIPEIVKRINLQIQCFCGHENRYLEIINHKIKQEEGVIGFPENTEIGFSFISGNQEIYNDALKRAKDDHRRYRVRREVLLDQPILNKEVIQMEYTLKESKTDIYESINNALVFQSLHPIVALKMGEFISNIHQRIRDHLFEKPAFQKGVFFEWGSNHEHILNFQSTFTLISLS